MRIHENGYVSGDPRVKPASRAGSGETGRLPDEVDVLIIGAGPAGMLTAAQLGRFGDITTCLVDRRQGRLEVGQADGISCRSVETFQAFGLADEITAEAQRITEMTFWQPDPEDPTRIVRTARAVDVPDGLSEFPHLIMNQARVLDYLSEYADQGPGRVVPQWGWEFQGLTVPEDPDARVEVRLTSATGEERTVRARYVVGADGARSGVRTAIGAEHTGLSANHAWGVVDTLAVTDFPDTRVKCAIQSRSGSLLLIPREGGFLYRMYIDLGPAQANSNVRATPLEDVLDTARAILHPYTLDMRHVPWFSVYEVGHRITDRFDDVLDNERAEAAPRVFLTGDACHTHSAKAGQGMNVSMQDGFNLGWKLAHVLQGRSKPSLLTSYADERIPVAQALVDFDKERARMSSASLDEMPSQTALQEHYAESAEYTAGFSVCYPPSLLIGDHDHQELATGFPIGRRFHSAPVLRSVDANPVHLGHLHEADGRWRIYAFADQAAPGEDSALARWASWLSTAPDSPLRAHARDGEDLDALFDVKVVYRTPREEFDITDVPEVFRPAVGEFGLIDQGKVFTSDPDAEDIFEARGIADNGAVVIVRPDQYVAHVLPLDATAELAAFFQRTYL